MASKGEKNGEDSKTNTTSAGSFHSDLEKAERSPYEGATGSPDLEHEEVEEVDALHQEDLEREKVSVP
jgi:hypothetical protein